MRKIILVLLVVFPSWLKVHFYRHILGWTIGKRVRIGLSYLDSEKVQLGDGVRIGHFNVIRNLREFRVGDDSYIANFNQFFGGKLYPDWDCCLNLENKVLLMSHHFIDVGGIVSIGSRVTMGGRETQVWSHSRVYDALGQPQLCPTNVKIGNDVYVGARAILVGCSIPDKSVVGAGSVVIKSFAAEKSPLLIAGNPGIIKKRYSMK